MLDVAHRHRHGHGVALAFAATLMFASADTLSKYLAGIYPINQIVFARYVVPLLLVVAMYGPRRGVALVRTQHPWLQVLRGLLLTSCTVTIVLAMRMMPIAEAQAISFIHPLLLTLIAVVFLRERVNPLVWLAIAMGFGGVLLIVRPGGGFDTPAVLLPLIMALSYALYQALTRYVTARDAVANSMFFVMLVGAAVTGISLMLSHKSPDLRGGLLLGCAGLLSGTGHFCMIRALESAPASRVAPVAYVQVLWVILLGAWVFGNLPVGLTLLGIAMVVGGGLFATMARPAPVAAALT